MEKRYVLPKEGSFYKANLHCHTVLSDGSLTAEEVKKAYMEHGYSIIAFTDHRKYAGIMNWTRKIFLVLQAS